MEPRKEEETASSMPEELCQLGRTTTRIFSRAHYRKFFFLSFPFCSALLSLLSFFFCVYILCTYDRGCWNGRLPPFRGGSVPTDLLAISGSQNLCWLPSIDGSRGSEIVNGSVRSSSPFPTDRFTILKFRSPAIDSFKLHTIEFVDRLILGLGNFERVGRVV